MFYDIKSCFKELLATNSVKDKEAILRAFIKNKEIKALLEANLNPYKLYQFNKMPVTFNELLAFDKFSEASNYKCFMELLDSLEKREITGDKAKRRVVDVFARMDQFEFDLYSKILLKSPIGVGASTVNKVWKGLVPEFKLLLAPNELPQVANIRYPVYVSPKMDGFRCVYYKGQLWSRQGIPIANQNLISYFSSLQGIKDYVLDGELYLHGTSFQNLSKVLRNETLPLPKGLKFVLFDCIEVSSWEAQECKKPYVRRLSDLRVVVNTLADRKKIIDVAQDKVETSKDLVDLYKQYLKDGYEGAMVRDMDGYYKWKRVTVKSGEVLKLKPKENLDVTVESIYDGEGKYAGMAGGFTFSFNGNSVRCGSGLTDLDRKAMAESPNDFVGKMAEIEYMEETDEGKSLRHPVFVRWRDDK
ncbi:MAG TPA: hypothetical protein VIL57_00915 [Bacteroidia bacterium]